MAYIIPHNLFLGVYVSVDDGGDYIEAYLEKDAVKVVAEEIDGEYCENQTAG